METKQNKRYIAISHGKRYSGAATCNFDMRIHAMRNADLKKEDRYFEMLEAKVNLYEVFVSFRLLHCVKSVLILVSYSGLHFPAFGLNTERYTLYLRIQSEYGKIRTRITSNTSVNVSKNSTLLSLV